jgi:hypothetical protein
MSINELLERKNTMLMKTITGMILRDNSDGLTRQEHFLLQKFLKEFHSNSLQLNQSKA